MLTLADFFRRPSVNAGGTVPKKKKRRKRRNKALIYRGKRFTLARPDAPLFGATQKAIGLEIGRAPKTISRRLSNSYREKVAKKYKIPIKPLQRTQVLIHLGDAAAAEHAQRESIERLPIVVYNDKAYLCRPNVYKGTAETPRSQRRVRQHLRQIEAKLQKRSSDDA